MQIAITRSPGPELAQCQLTHLPRQAIDLDRARAQHRAYQDALRGAGIRVIELPADPALPDGPFVEDTAVVLDEIAVIAAPAPVSRRAEVIAVEAALRPFRPVVRLPAGGLLEGGDVLRVERSLYVGLTARTNEAGLWALEKVVRPLGYTVVPVQVNGCLHLKSACGLLDRETVLVNRSWVDTRVFAGLRLVDVPAEEPWAANVLALPGVVLVSAAYPRMVELVQGRGHTAVALDVSEFHKAEGALTCLSLIFAEERLNGK